MEGRYKTIVQRKAQVVSGIRIEVCESLDTWTNKYVVVEKFPYKKVEHGVPFSVIREVSILKELQHKNIVRLLDVRANTKEVTLVFENFDCTLKSFIKDKPWESLERMKVFLYQILSGVLCCHLHNILHRRIKLSNILVCKHKMVVKLANFGISREVGVPCKAYTHEAVGTLQYMAPELLFGCKEYSYPVDIWAVGCIFGYMVKGRKLFDGDTIPNMLNNIFRVLGTPDEQTWPGVTKLFPRLHEIETYSPQILANEVRGLEDDGVDLLYRMLRLDPSKRITAQEALRHPYFKTLELAPVSSLRSYLQERFSGPLTQEINVASCSNTTI